jgi:hypothetical protein
MIDMQIAGLTAQLSGLSERIDHVRHLVRGIQTANPRTSVLVYISDLEPKADALKVQIARLTAAYEVRP